MARPTKLTTEIIRDVKGYMVMCAEKSRLPTIEGLAFVLNLNKGTIQEWRKPYYPTNTQITETENQELVQLHTEFSALVDMMLNQQADQLIDRGLNETYNASITKLLLTKHGYRDAVDTDITTGGEKVNTVLPEIIAEADRLLKIKKLNEASPT